MKLLEEGIDKLILLLHLSEEVLAFIWGTSGFSALNNTVVLARFAALAHVLAWRKITFHLETLAIRARSGKSVGGPG